MRYETMTLGSNVIRFPVELRAKPSIDLLIEVAPDSREVELIAEAFGFERARPGWAEQGGSRDGGDDREDGFAGRSEGAAGGVERDAEAARRSRGRRLRRSAPGGAAFGRSRRAKLASAQIEGGYWLAPLEDAANHWAVESARLQLTAYEAAQAAHGAGRAIEFAKRGEPWRPSNVEEDVDALIAAQRALAR